MTTAPLLTELRLLGGSEYGAPAATWIATTRIQVPGCYAYQLDGLGFSDQIIFQATFS